MVLYTEHIFAILLVIGILAAIGLSVRQSRKSEPRQPPKREPQTPEEYMSRTYPDAT